MRAESRTSLTLVAVFYNEEKKLPGYFRNIAGIADHIVVVDCSSTDRTAEICRAAGAKVLTSPYRYFEQNVNKAIEVVATEWILIVDADERLSPGLKTSIINILKGPACDAYSFRRVDYMFSGFANIGRIDLGNIVRLFRKGHWTVSEQPHATPVVTGKVSSLPGLLFHYSYTDVGFYVSKMARYISEMPREYIKKGNTNIFISERHGFVRRIFGAHGLRRMLLFPPFQILNYLFRHRFIFEGRRGIVYSVGAGIYAFWEEAIYWDMENRKTGASSIDWRSEYPERSSGDCGEPCRDR